MKPTLKIHDRKTIIFLVCLAISIFMWLLIKLSKEYELEVAIPVQLVNLSKDQLLISKSDSIVKVRVKDNGFDLLGTSLFGASSPIIIDIKTLHKRKLKKGRSKAYFLTRSLDDFLQNEFNSAHSISRIKPDSLVYIFEEEASKKVDIHAKVEFSLSPQFQLQNPVKLTPQSIKIYGSNKALSQIDYINTEEIRFSNLNKDIHQNIKLIIPSTVKSKFSEVQLFIDVEKFTEASIQIPIQHQFSRQGEVKIFPKHIDIKYAVSLKDYHLIKPEQFQLLCKEDSLSIGKLNIAIKDFPDNVRIIDYSPKIAEFIYIK